MLTDFIIPQVEDMDQADIHFERDGATCHTTRENLSLLRDHFPGRLVSRFGGVKMPARFQDLLHPVFFFWGHLKERLYRYNPQSLTKLKEAIGNEIRYIGSDVTKAVLTV